MNKLKNSIFVFFISFFIIFFQISVLNFVNIYQKNFASRYMYILIMISFSLAILFYKKYKLKINYFYVFSIFSFLQGVSLIFIVQQLNIYWIIPCLLMLFSLLYYLVFVVTLTRSSQLYVWDLAGSITAFSIFFLSPISFTFFEELFLVNIMFSILIIFSVKEKLQRFTILGASFVIILFSQELSNAIQDLYLTGAKKQNFAINMHDFKWHGCDAQSCISTLSNGKRMTILVNNNPVTDVYNGQTSISESEKKYIKKGSHAFISGIGGGNDIALATLLGFSEIHGTEINRHIINIMTLSLSSFSHHIYDKAKIFNSDTRTYLKQSDFTYDLMIFKGSGYRSSTTAFVSNAGNYSYTIEALEEYWKKLNPGGQIYISKRYQNDEFKDRYAYSLIKTAKEFASKTQFADLIAVVPQLSSENRISIFITKSSKQKGSIQIISDLKQSNSISSAKVIFDDNNPANLRYDIEILEFLFLFAIILITVFLKRSLKKNLVNNQVYVSSFFSGIIYYVYVEIISQSYQNYADIQILTIFGFFLGSIISFLIKNRIKISRFERFILIVNALLVYVVYALIRSGAAVDPKILALIVSTLSSSLLSLVFFQATVFSSKFLDISLSSFAAYIAGLLSFFTINYFWGFGAVLLSFFLSVFLVICFSYIKSDI